MVREILSLKQISFDKGKPGESRRRKAYGSKVTQSDYDGQAAENDMNTYHTPTKKIHVFSISCCSGAFIVENLRWRPQFAYHAS